jgi:hypothetical protein
LAGGGAFDFNRNPNRLFFEGMWPFAGSLVVIIQTIETIEYVDFRKFVFSLKIEKDVCGKKRAP